MTTYRLLIILNLFLNLSSCTNNSSNNIESFILQYKNETFSTFSNVSISYRDSDLGDDIYVVAKQGGKFPPYIVRYNKRKNKTMSIDTSLLLQSNFKNYFTEAFIKDIMDKFISLNVKNLSVDSFKNVCITPLWGANTPNLLRLDTSIKINEKIIKKGYTYELYKDNWYINKTD